MHLDVMSDEGVLFRSFKYKRHPEVIDELNGKTVRSLTYYPPPVDRILFVTDVGWGSGHTVNSKGLSGIEKSLRRRWGSCLALSVSS